MDTVTVTQIIEVSKREHIQVQHDQGKTKCQHSIVLIILTIVFYYETLSSTF